MEYDTLENIMFNQILIKPKIHFIHLEDPRYFAMYINNRFACECEGDSSYEGILNALKLPFTVDFKLDDGWMKKHNHKFPLTLEENKDETK